MKYILTQAFGKQYLFKPNEIYDINLNYKFNNKTYLKLNKILFFKNNLKIQLGYPFLNNTKILLKIIKKISKSKLIILKTKPKKKYTRTQGSKIKLTRILIIN